MNGKYILARTNAIVIATCVQGPQILIAASHDAQAIATADQLNRKAGTLVVYFHQHLSSKIEPQLGSTYSNY